MIILVSLALAVLVIIGVLLFLLFNRVGKLIAVISSSQSEEYSKSVATQKTKKPSLPAIKQKVRGRSVTKTEDLVDIADLDWETGYKVLEELGNG